VLNNPLSKVDPLGLDDCSPDEPDCRDPCDWDPMFCDAVWGPPGGGGGGGGSNPPSPPHNGGGGPSTPQHGPWPGNETTGLPQLPTQPLSLGDLLGLTPGCDFGVCDPIGNGFVSGVSGAGTADSPFTIFVNVLESAGPLLGGCAVTPGCQDVLLAGAVYVGLVATTHYFGRPQSNEWTDMAKQFAPKDPCGWLAAQRQLPQNQDSVTQGKIVQAQKFLKCRNINKRNQ
jgi:hypothetical protein